MVLSSATHDFIWNMQQMTHTLLFFMFMYMLNAGQTTFLKMNYYNKSLFNHHVRGLLLVIETDAHVS